MRRRIVLALAIGSLAVTLAGCGGTSADSGASATATSPTESAAAPGSAGAATGDAVGAPGVADASATRAPANGESAPPVTTDGVTITGAVGAQPTIAVTPGAQAPKELVVVDIYPGTGEALEPGGSGVFDYEGVLYSDGTVFDSSWERGQPVSLSLDRVIPGWQEGLVGMKEGGRRALIIPPDQAYGAQAIPGIAPNSTLIFVVDLQKVTG
ncbi:MAG: hypothetical protein QG597_3244 [Actinomycetota bacterium]|nr:hypothetical protein [Actinomycetota bacterium]